MKTQEQEIKASENRKVTCFSLLYIERKCQQLQEWQRLMPAFLEIAISLQTNNSFPSGAPDCLFLIFFFFLINIFLKNIVFFIPYIFFLICEYKRQRDSIKPMFYYSKGWEAQGGIQPKMPPLLVLSKKKEKKCAWKFFIGVDFYKRRSPYWHEK